MRYVIESEFSKSKYCALTTDLWTSQHQHHSYISLTAHYITPDFELKARCLQTTEILTDHTAQLIASLLQAFEKEMVKFLQLQLTMVAML